MSAALEKADRATGRPSAPPVRRLKARLLPALYSIRSERPRCERIDTDPLFRWFPDMRPADDAFDPTTFTPNRARLGAHGPTGAFFAAVVGEAVAAGRCRDPVTVDGTRIPSWAAAKSVPPIPAGGAGASGRPPGGGNGSPPRNVEVDSHGPKRTNETHRSRTDPEARRYRQGPGKGAKRSHMGHALGENRHGRIVAVAVTAATGTAAREAAPAMLDKVTATGSLRPSARGADKGYDDGPFLLDPAGRRVVPHVPGVPDPQDPAGVRHRDRRSGAEARPRMRVRLGTAGYRPSQKCRRKIAEGLGWLRSVAGRDRSRVVGRWARRPRSEVGAGAYNLVRLRSLTPARRRGAGGG